MISDQKWWLRSRGVVPQARWAPVFRRYGVLVALAVLLIVMGISSPSFFRLHNFFNILSQWTPVGIMAVGATYVILAGGFDLSAASGFALWKWERSCNYAILPVDMFRNKSLSALFTLSILGGFTMFSLLFYAPLLFQGGFGMSPKDAGLMITPLVVFITIGSIVNGRIVTRVKNPNAMLFVGFALLAVACLGVVIATRSMPRPLLMMFMVLGGLGLGFVMPNLTVFAQVTAGREHLGQLLPAERPHRQWRFWPTPRSQLARQNIRVKRPLAAGPQHRNRRPRPRVFRPRAGHWAIARPQLRHARARGHHRRSILARLRPK